uniref:Origin of replication binding protein n=1 Tax=Marseillevirus sp. TaxID=2809551 RepID=A0AA96J3I8_9VIRU|nr:origin of replication binding protein [Marseillevirus sp.]
MSNILFLEPFAKRDNNKIDENILLHLFVNMECYDDGLESEKDDGVIYLIRNDSIWKDGVFKVGKTRNWKKRSCSYGKVRLLHCFRSDFISESEKDVINQFSKHFPVAFGKEYFLCSEEEAVRTFRCVEEKMMEKTYAFGTKFLFSVMPFCSPEKGKKEKKEKRKFLYSEKLAGEICEAEPCKSEDIPFLKRPGRSREDKLRSSKYCFAKKFKVEQKDLTPEFILEYDGKEKIFENQSLAFCGSKAEQKERLADLLERKNNEKKDLKASERIGMSCNLEKVVYARRLFYWLGYGSTTTREKKSKEEMTARLEKIRERIKKSRHFQELLGKMPDEEKFMVKYINGILKRMFDCYIARTSRKTSFFWELVFCSPWKHGDEITPIPKKKVHSLEVIANPF